MIVEIVWTLVALGGLIRALTLWREAVIDRRSVRGIVNGRRLLARWQVEHAFMGVFIYFFLLMAGISALVYRFDVIPLHTRLLIASLSLVAALLALATRQERDAYYRRRTLLANASHLEEVAVDTNVRVREMQQRGQHDQPLEEEDRQEGRDHRHPEERQ